MKSFGSASPFPSLDNTEAGVLDAVTPGTAVTAMTLESASAPTTHTAASVAFGGYSTS